MLVDRSQVGFVDAPLVLQGRLFGVRVSVNFLAWT